MGGRVVEEVILLVGLMAVGGYHVADWVGSSLYPQEHSAALAVAAALAQEKLGDLRVATPPVTDNAGGKLAAGGVVRGGVEYVRSWTVAKGEVGAETPPGEKVVVTITWQDSLAQQQHYTLGGVVFQNPGGLDETKFFSTHAMLSNMPMGQRADWLAIRGTIRSTSLEGVGILVSGHGRCHVQPEQGAYTCWVPRFYSGAIVPVKAGISFSPREIELINLITDRNRQDFEAG